MSTRPWQAIGDGWIDRGAITGATAQPAIDHRPLAPSQSAWILGISGSLRRDSVNSAAIRAAARVAWPETRVAIVTVLGDIPAFSPDREAAPPPAVRRFLAACRTSAGVLLAVPEYAHGIPGAFKNALDWTVGAGALDQKPVTVLNVAPTGRGSYVQRSLLDVLSALGCDVEQRSIPVRSETRVNGEILAAPILCAFDAVVAELVQRSNQRKESEQ